MAIKSMKVLNIMAFHQKELDLQFGDGINILIGENGMGKTTLLKMIYAALQYSIENQTSGKELIHFFSNNLRDFSQMKYPGKEKDTCYYEISDGQHFFKDYLTKKNGIVSEGWKGLNIQSVFIPTTEMLSHSKGFLAMNQKYNMPFDETQIDIIVNASLPETKKVSQSCEIILKEMIESLSMDLFEKHLVTNKLVLTIGYDIENMKDYRGEIMEDRYGRKLPKHLHGTINLDRYTSSYKLMCDALLRFYHLHINHALTIRRIQLNATQVRSDDDIPVTYKQLSLFDEEKIEVDLSKEKKLQSVTLDIKKKYGKNALLKGTDLQEGATTRERNKMIGGHNA
mgnify:CR=1 FL=1